MPERRRGPARCPWQLALVLAAALVLLVTDVGSKAATNFFWHPEIAPDGPVVIVISLDEQNIYVYRNGVAIGVSPISSGRAGYETPAGVYSILQKEREHRSNLYDDAPMPYMQRLTWDGIALHGGVLPGHPASHGCVRLPQSFAEKLFTVTRRSGIVVVADTRIFPARISHPAAVAPIDLAGQPMPAPIATDATVETPLPEDGPVSVVASTRDRMLYVLRSGLLVASSPLEAGDQVPSGTLLYVMGQPPAQLPEGAAPEDTLPTWSAYRILGKGPVPEPASLAHQLQVPPDFGQRLRAMLVPGSTMLVTDLPGYGGAQRAPFATLLESDQAAAR